MEGVNVGPRLTRVSLIHEGAEEDLRTGFLHLLALERINMNLLVSEGGRALCCVAAADGSRMGELIRSNPNLQGGALIEEPVGLMSIFPIRSSFKAVGQALIALAEAHVPVYGFCSSLSALTVVIDHDRLDDALTAFEGGFDFPGERAAKR